MLQIKMAAFSGPAVSVTKFEHDFGVTPLLLLSQCLRTENKNTDLVEVRNVFAGNQYTRSQRETAISFASDGACASTSAASESDQISSSVSG